MEKPNNHWYKAAFTGDIERVADVDFFRVSVEGVGVYSADIQLLTLDDSVIAGQRAAHGDKHSRSNRYSYSHANADSRPDQHADSHGFPHAHPIGRGLRQRYLRLFRRL